VNAEEESALVLEAENYRDCNGHEDLPSATLPDWMWDRMPEGYAEDFQRRTGIVLKRYEE
jgi:hypothetical protein